MDFAWVVDALRRGLKVTRNKHNWNDNAQVRYLYMTRNDAGNHVIRMRPSGGLDFEWQPSAVDILDVTDWEEYVEPKKKPAAGYISLSSEKETRLPNNPSYDDTQDSHGGKPMEEPDLDAETNKVIALVARNIAEDLVELLRNPSVQRILQKTDAPR